MMRIRVSKYWCIFLSQVLVACSGGSSVDSGFGGLTLASPAASSTPTASPTLSLSLASLTVTNSAFTNTRTYSLSYGSVTGTYSSYCLLENDTTLADCVFIVGVLPANFTVATTENAKTLSVWIKDSQGNVSSRVDSNSVTYDVTAPVLASATISNANPSNTRTYNLTYGSVTGTYSSYCILENDTTLADCSFVAGTLPSSYSVTATENAKVLSIWLKDAATNVSTRVDTASVTLDTTAPILASASVSNTSPTNTRTYNLTYGSVTGTYSSYCILENDSTLADCTFTNGTLPATFTVTSTEGGKALSIWLKDSATNVSTRVDTASVTLDTTAAVLGSATISNSSPTTSTTYNLTFGSVTGTYASYCILENDTTLADCSFTSGALPSSFTVSSTTNAKVLSVWLKDSANNVSTRVDTNSVTLAAASLSGITLSGYSTSVTTGNTVTITATAVDGSGNPIASNTDSLTITSSDGSAILPTPTFSSGAVTFNVTLVTPGTQTITVTDAAHTSIHTDTSSITVSTGTYTSLMQVGNSGFQMNGLGIGVDSDHSVIVGGNTNGNFTTCSGVNCATSASTGTFDYFLVKYNSSGTWQWTQQLGVSGKSTVARGVAVDLNKNVFIAGATQGNLTTCAGVSTSCSGSATGTQDYFISKYNASGTWQWTVQLGETGKNVGFPNATVLLTDSAGAVYLTGTTTGNLAGCSGVSGACGGTSASGASDQFVSKYDKDGNWQWTKQIGETGKTVTAGLSGIAIDASDNVIIATTTTGSLPGCSGTTGACGAGSSQGTLDYAITKYNSSGNWQWTVQLGETGKTVAAIGVTTDSAKNVIIAGTTTGNFVTCAGASGACAGASSQGTSDFFITQYDLNGNWVWTKQFGETGKAALNSGSSLRVDNLDNIYVSGYTQADLKSCNGASGACSGSASAGTNDLFISKYTKTGTWNWTKQLGQSGKNTTNVNIANDPQGYLMVTGSTTGNLSSCGGVSASCSGSATGSQDFFIAKYTH